jgi:hypothetical protein
VANANPVTPGVKDAPATDKSAKPEVQYFGEGADKVKFEVDPKAKLIRVYSTGMVLVDY